MPRAKPEASYVCICLFLLKKYFYMLLTYGKTNGVGRSGLWWAEGKTFYNV